MPYVITTRAYATSSACPRLPAPRTRRAVATLEEAVREGVRLPFEGTEAWNALVANGGTIGPLPDGTVIEVEQVGFADLWREADYPKVPGVLARTQEQAIIDAYNAREARS